MTPHTKARQLIAKFQTGIFKNGNPNNMAAHGKECATICVDEIISSIDWHEFETPNKQFEYWNVVKNEISLL